MTEGVPARVNTAAALVVAVVVTLAAAGFFVLADAVEPASASASAGGTGAGSGALSPAALRTTAMGLFALLAFAVMLRYADEA